MTWNYRIIEFPDHFALHEVFYDSKGNVQSYTAEPVSFTSDKEEGAAGVVESLSMALADARRRDVLNHADLPKGEGNG